MSMDLPKAVGPGKVAVVTGAALGIGRAICRRFAAEGMSVVLADLQGSDLDAAEAEVRALAAGGDDAVLAVPSDVGEPEQIAALASATMGRFGRVDVLVNNAVTRIGRGFDADIADWQRAFDVNVWGVVGGVKAFLPHLLAADGARMIVNVGSKQGITNPPGHPVYNMAKAALKTYTEALEHDLRERDDNQGGDRLTAHLLVPGWTTTGHSEHKAGAWLPDQVVDALMARAAAGDFYVICPDGEVSEDMDRKRILWGAGDLTENRPPLSRWHPDFKDVAAKACS